MQNETILCISTRRWNSLWRSTQQYMSRFANQNRVLFFEPGRNPDKSVPTEFIRNIQNYFQLRSQQVQENLIVVQTPSSFPYARRQLPKSILKTSIPFIAKLNSQLLIRKVSDCINAWDVKNPILWLYSPRHIDLVGKFGEKLVCYFVYDEYSDFTGNELIKDLLVEYDNQMVNRVDIVFTSSRSQLERRNQLNPQTYFIPNAVDFSLFNKALLPETPIPTDITDCKKPVIGFVGWLGYHIDVVLLIRLAEEFPHGSIVLIGPDQIPRDENYYKLVHFSNVFLLGKRDIEQLPSYLKSFDVALIPYRLEGHVLSCYPLKLNEYLAAGVPIVSVDLPEITPFHDVVSIGKSHDQFIDLVSKAIFEHSRETIDKRVDTARQNSWDQRVLKMSSLIDELLLAKKNASFK